MRKIDLQRKLTSRKFWMAVALFVSGILTATGKGTQAETVAGLIMQGASVIAYIIGEGLTDSKCQSDMAESTVEYYEEDEEDDV